MRTVGSLAFVLVAMAVVVRSSAADFTDYDCRHALLSAAVKYESCQNKAILKLVADPTIYRAAAAKCVAKYDAVWPKLSQKAYLTFNTCDHSSRFDAGTGIVFDHLTGLTWEQKTNLDAVSNLGDPHDADNTYSWAVAPGDANGTVYTAFLNALNDACFAGVCNWRLPTLFEVEAILPLPCTGSPCIDAAFGPTPGAPFWTGMQPSIGPGSGAWYIDFSNGNASVGDKTSFAHARAVRQ